GRAGGRVGGLAGRVDGGHGRGEQHEVVEGFVAQDLVQHPDAAVLGEHRGPQVVRPGEGQGPVPQVQGRVHGRGDRAERGVGHRERGPDVVGTGHVALDVAGASAGRFHGGQPFGDGGVGGGAAAEPDDVGGGGAGQVAAEGV